MAILFGARTNKGERKDTEQQIVSLALKKITAQTTAGEFSNVSEIDAAIKSLSNLPPSVELEGAVADLEAKKRQFEVRRDDMQNSEGIFRDNLNDALKEGASNNFGSIDALVFEYANIYNDAEERLDSFINENVYKRYGSAAQPSEGLLNLKKEIKEKSRYYSTLQFALSDPTQYANIDTESLGIAVRTNPVTRKIVSVDVLPISEIPKDMMKTDIKSKYADVEGAPASNIWVNTVDLGYDESGKVKMKRGVLGSVDFQGKSRPITVGGDVEEGGFLEAQRKNTTWFDWFKFGAAQEEEDRNEQTNDWISAAKTNGVNLAQFSFDGNDIPDGSVVRKGNRLYYQMKGGDVVEFSGSDLKSRAETAKKYLETIGENPNKLNAPAWVDDTYFVQDGRSRVKSVVNEDTLKAPTAESKPMSSLQDMGSEFTALGATIPPASFFSDPNRVKTAGARVNRPTKPEAPTDSVEGMTIAAKVIDKGRSFFRNRVA